MLNKMQNKLVSTTSIFLVYYYPSLLLDIDKPTSYDGRGSCRPYR